LKVCGIKTRALLDWGSFHSILSAELARRFRIKIEPLIEQTNLALFAANGSPLKLLGRAHVTLDVNQLRSQHEVIILGWSLLYDAEAVLDFKNETVTFSDFLEIPLHKFVNKDTLVRVKNFVRVPPNSKVIFPVNLHPKFNNSDVLITPGEGEQFSHFALANTISRVSRGRTLCRLFNFRDKLQVLCENQKLCHTEHFYYI
jgi:hypothetical protein